MRSAAACIVAALATACGSSSSSPTTPSTTTTTTTNVFATPTTFLQSSQKINATNNELTFTWTGNASTYQFVVGSSPGTSNLLTATVTGTTYTWTSPRTGGAYYARVAALQNGTVGTYSDELSLFVLDIRNVIDALFFHAGPMADVPSTANSNPAAGIWADGTVLSVLVESQAGETARANAQTFANDYAALFDNKVTATATITGTSLRNVDFTALPNNTVGVRIQSGFCSTGALGCAYYGPAPLGPNRSMVTLDQSGGLYVSATGHEMGHAYGLGHVTKPAAGRPEFRFMMNPSYTNEQMTDVEKLAITVARSKGIRPGMTRNEALAADMVNPFTGTSNATGARGAFSERRDASGWILVGLTRPLLLLHERLDVGDLHRQCLR